MMTTYKGKRDYAFGQAMFTLRTAIGLTQEGLGNRLGISRRSVGKWEVGNGYPKPQHLKELILLAVKCQAFTAGNETAEIRAFWKAAHQKMLLDEGWLSALLAQQCSPQGQALEQQPPTAPEPLKEVVSSGPIMAHPASQEAPEIQNVPFPPNPFFTGRESLLSHLGHLFEQSAHIAITQPISVSGLGGIGKTQLALEYAHRCYLSVYRSVLWVNASDKASLEASYLSLAYLLKLPEEREREVDRIVQAVKIWLEQHTHWLLILDNADDLQLARSFLPTKHRGHILLTTRSRIVGNIASLIQVEAMSAHEGLYFLLRRSGVLKSGSELESIPSAVCAEAEALVEMLSGHPLALDQAGAYIEETRDPGVCATSASFSEYRQLYQEQRRMLLKRRGSLGGEHPETVALTFEISFHKASQLHPSCADVLSLCAFLHPDAIAEELLRQGLKLDQYLLNEVIRALRSYSLIKRNAEKQVLSLHRLVQVVIQDSMDIQTLNRWKRCAVQVVNEAFPEVTFEEWERCERYLPHAQILASWIEHEAVPPLQAAHLLEKAGIYLRERGQYPDAELLLVRALSIRELHLGPEHPDMAQSLNNLASLYWLQGKYEQAEPLFQRAILIREQHLGVEHPDTAKSLNGLANLYQHQGKYEQAKPLRLRALSIREQQLGAKHPSTAQSLNNLANLYFLQGKYEQAEPLFQRALSIQEQHLGVEHPDTAKVLTNLAGLYRQQGKYEQAEPLYLRALAIWEPQLGAEHPDTAYILHEWAKLYQRQGRYEQAEPLFQRTLAIREKRLGAEHPDTASSLHGLAELYQRQGKYEQAEPLFQRALRVRAKCLGPNHPDTEESRKVYAAFIRKRAHG